MRCVSGELRANGLVERMNGTLFQGVARALTGLPKGKWIDVLPNVLWSIRTKVNRPTSFTPFRLLYGSEAVTPEELKLGSLRTTQSTSREMSEGATKHSVSEEMLSKDLLEEARLQAVNNLCKYMASVEKTYNQKVHLRQFALGDLVLKRHPS